MRGLLAHSLELPSVGRQLSPGAVFSEGWHHGIPVLICAQYDHPEVFAPERSDRLFNDEGWAWQAAQIREFRRFFGETAPSDVLRRPVIIAPE